MQRKLGEGKAEIDGLRDFTENGRVGLEIGNSLEINENLVPTQIQSLSVAFTALYLKNRFFFTETKFSMSREDIIVKCEDGW